MYKHNATAKDSKSLGFCWEQVIAARGSFNCETADELAPDYERVISRAQMGDKLYAAESKLSKANALFADVHDVHFVKPAYNIESPDEDEQRDAAALLSKYPHWRLLLEMVHDTTLEAEAIIKELRTGL